MWDAAWTRRFARPARCISSVAPYCSGRPRRRSDFEHRLFLSDLELLVGEIVIGCLECLPRDATGYTVEFECRRSEDGKDIVLLLRRSAEPPASGVDAGPPGDDVCQKGFDFLKRLTTNMVCCFQPGARAERDDADDSNSGDLAWLTVLLWTAMRTRRNSRRGFWARTAFACLPSQRALAFLTA